MSKKLFKLPKIVKWILSIKLFIINAGDADMHCHIYSGTLYTKIGTQLTI